jgi:hypothetical protein
MGDSIESMYLAKKTGTLGALHSQRERMHNAIAAAKQAQQTCELLVPDP